MRPRSESVTRAICFSFLLLATLGASGRAEIYRGIGPLDDLADLKAMFPGAKFEKLAPAWAQESDVLYSISGAGMSGTIVVKFSDNRPFWRQQLASVTDSAQIAMISPLADAPDDQITVDWVRWIPEAPIPLQRFVTKYGTPEKSDFSEENMQPYKEWVSRGLQVYLSDDGKYVLHVDYGFTIKDNREAWKTKRGYVPDFLKPEKPHPEKK